MLKRPRRLPSIYIGEERCNKSLHTDDFLVVRKIAKRIENWETYGIQYIQNYMRLSSTDLAAWVFDLILVSHV